MESKYTDPYTGRQFQHPVKMEDGYTYEKDNIIKYMDEHGNKSPMTGQVMSRNMTPNKDLEDEIKKKGEKISFVVKVLNGKTYIINELYETSTFDDLKECISRKTNMAKSAFTYQIGPKTLSGDKKTLKELKITENSIVRVMTKQTGG